MPLSSYLVTYSQSENASQSQNADGLIGCIEKIKQQNFTVQETITISPYLTILKIQTSRPLWYLRAQVTRLSENIVDIERDTPVKLHRQVPLNDYSNKVCDTKALPNLKSVTSPYLPGNVFNGWYDPGYGNGILVYVIDTGIDIKHPAFRNNRAVYGFSAIDNDAHDYNGHGTHVAATIVGQTFGITRQATAVAVRVLNDKGDGSLSQLLSGISYIAHVGRAGQIINMSIGAGRTSTSLDNALRYLAKKNLILVTAAGNDNRNACLESPASMPEAITVAAAYFENNALVRAPFSNWGRCVDIYAPGVRITSAEANTGMSTEMDGTSMACPHVAAVAAAYSGMNIPASQIVAYITKTSKQNVVQNNIRDTNSNFIYLYNKDFQC